MNNLIKDFSSLVINTEYQDNVAGHPYSIHDTRGLLILCDKGDQHYYLVTTILITVEELNLYSKTAEVGPNKLLFELLHDLTFYGDDQDVEAKERFDKERTLFSIEKKKVKSDFFGVGKYMFDSKNLKFDHREFYYQIILKRQKKDLGRKNNKKKTKK